MWGLFYLFIFILLCDCNNSMFLMFMSVFSVILFVSFFVIFAFACSYSIQAEL